MDTLRPPHLLLVVNHLPFLASHRREIALEALRQGYRVSIACPDDPMMTQFADDCFEMHGIRLSRARISPVSEVQSLIGLVRLFRQIRPDVVHLITPKPVIYGGLAARASGIPVLAAISGLGHVFAGQSLRQRVLRRIARLAYRGALNHPRCRVVFQNSDDLKVFRDAGIMDKAQTALIPGSGVDLTRIRPQPLSDGPPVVLLPARMLRAKGVPEFLDAAEVFRTRGHGAVFRLLGDPDPMNPTSLTRDELEMAARAPNVEWRPYNADMNAELAQAHLVVLPSSYREGLPKTLIDAAAAGRSVVTTDHPGCRDAILPGETGLLVRVHDAAGTARAIAELLDDPDRLRAMGAAARLHAERVFDIDLVVRRHCTFYAELCGSGPTPHQEQSTA
ncbi:MAG: glycosyltransferase family 4 protein [Pseudomonadota bacterium]